MAEIKSLPPLSYRSTLFGKRRSLLLWITTITIICGALIGLNPKSLFNENSFKLAIEFFKASASPAFDYEKPVNGADPFLKTVFYVVRTANENETAVKKPFRRMDGTSTKKCKYFH